MHKATLKHETSCCRVFQNDKQYFYPLLGAFPKLQKRLLASSCLSVRPSVRFPLDGFRWNLLFRYFFRLSAEKIQVLLKSDKNNGNFNLQVSHPRCVLCKWGWGANAKPTPEHPVGHPNVPTQKDTARNTADLQCFFDFSVPFSIPA